MRPIRRAVVLYAAVLYAAAVVVPPPLFGLLPGWWALGLSVLGCVVAPGAAALALRDAWRPGMVLGFVAMALTWLGLFALAVAITWKSVRDCEPYGFPCGEFVPLLMLFPMFVGPVHVTIVGACATLSVLPLAFIPDRSRPVWPEAE